jgi:subtilisin family serine protease
MNTENLTSEDYGFSFAQNQQIGTPYLHSLGYNGDGIDVAVFDAGFQNILEIPAFVRHQSNQRMTLGYDLADLDNEFVKSDNHGTSVSTCLGAYDRGHYIGSAPLAHLILFRTENGATEYPIEELNWCKAAELADSIGVDIITSSLGYNKFDDSNLSYKHQDLDGKTTFASLGARVASEKGILLLNSAGNEGDNEWRKIGTPADVPTVLTIGAVDIKNKVGKFSSQGYNAAGDIKPDVAACGVLAYVGSASGSYYQGYGTSYATPIAAGGVACLMQAFPDLSASEIIRLIQQTASQASEPDSFMGYGVAQFDVAHKIQTLKNSKSNIPTIVKVDHNQIVVYTSAFSSLQYSVYYNSKLFNLFNIKKNVTKGKMTRLSAVSVFPLDNLKADCSKKYTIQIKLKSDVGNYELVNNDLEICEN